jgi:hypothetical protein
LRIAHEVKGLAWTSRSASPSQDDRSGLSLQQSCRVWPSSKRLDAYVRDAHEAYVLGGCLGHTLEFFEDFLFFGVLRKELSTTGMWW